MQTRCSGSVLTFNSIISHAMAAVAVLQCKVSTALLLNSVTKASMKWPQEEAVLCNNWFHVNYII